ncbi:MAG TPA: 5-oxoprolinase subunit PxpA [Solirubrobacterales bacterium]
MRKTIDVNCDAGESFGNWTMGDDEAMFPHVSSANIASGFHAGDPVTLLRTVRLAQRHGLAIGAHPGLPDLLGFGRRAMAVDAEDVYAYLVYQVGAVRAAAEAVGGELRYVKLHGAFASVLQEDERAEAAVQAIKDAMPGAATVYYTAQVEGDLWPVALKRNGVRFVGEIYPDMLYAADGNVIVERVKHVTEPADAADFVSRFLRTGCVQAKDGPAVPVEAESICVHGDGPNALAVLAAVTAAVEAEGVAVAAPFGEPANPPAPEP